MSSNRSISDKELSLAIPLVSTGNSRGTGVLVAENLVLTALHVVADRRPDPPDFYKGQISLQFGFKATGYETRTARIFDKYWDRINDWVLLEFEGEPPAKPFPLALPPSWKQEWRTYGYPELKRDGIWCDGTVKATAVPVDNAIALQVAVDVGRGAN